MLSALPHILTPYNTSYALFITDSTNTIKYPIDEREFKIGGQIIHTVKYADDLVLLAKEEKVLQDIIDKLIKM
jgi:hypothetical protein